MSILDQVLGSSGTDVAGLASRFGLNPDQAQSALSSLMPAVLGGFQKKSETGELAPATDAVTDGAQSDSDAGNGVLGHIFGSKDVSRQVADHASGESGVSSTVIKAMLPVVAAMVARHLAGQRSGNAADPSAGAQGGLGGILGSLLGGATGGGMGGLGGLLGGANNSENPLDQILARMR